MKQYIRCRAIIIKDGQMLVVNQNIHHNFWALPGGKLEFGETPIECMKRELLEELGVTAQVGQLLYVSTFTEAEIQKHHVEFIFQIDNPEDFTDQLDLTATHAFELSELAWLVPNSDKMALRPNQIQTDFDQGKLGRLPVKWIW